MATCAANSIGALILLLVYFASQKNSVISLSWRYFRPGGGVITSVAELGLPVALMILCTICCDFIRIRFLSALGGVEQVAAWGICTKICNAIMQINTGIASGVRPLCAYNFAAGNRIRTQEVIRTTLIITMIFNAVCVLILECFPQTAAAFFTDNVSVSARASVYLRCYIVSALGIGLNEVTAALLQATERWKLSLSAAFINKAVLLNGGTWIAGMLFGIPGIVVSQSVTESMAAAILLFLERATRFSHARK